MRGKQSYIVIGILFLAGLSLLLYPWISNKWNTYRQTKLINQYESVVEEKEKDHSINYGEERKAAVEYNNKLVPSVLPDSFAKAEQKHSENYMELLNIAGDSVMGVVEIPRINVRLPILHTTDKEVLEKGAGHLEGSSLPVGGKGTHAVISAHRGLPSATLFTDLDKVKKGDHFILKVLDENLCYKVDRIKVVEPKDTKGLKVEDDKDLVTLLTCTPYGVNSHRLLVRGHRVPYTEEIADVESAKGFQSLHSNYLLWVLLGLQITAVVVIVLFIREKKWKERKRKAPSQQS